MLSTYYEMIRHLQTTHQMLLENVNARGLTVRLSKDWVLLN